MLTRFELDRNSGVPLFRQLQAAIEMSIIEGDLGDGTSLPSVRALASAADVAPITVVQAYKELQHSGLIQSVPKRGFFVTVSPSPPETEASYRKVRELIDHAITVALETGIDEREFSRLAVERARRFRTDQRTVAVFGDRHASLDARVAATAAAMSDMNVQVVGIAFEDIADRSIPERDETLDRIDIFLVSVGQIEEAAALLGKGTSRILPMTRVPTVEVEEFIRGWPDSAQFGIVGESQDYASRIVAALRRIRSLQMHPIVTTVDDPAGIDQVMRESDAVLLGSLASSRIDPAILRDPKTTVFTTLPDSVTFEKLRRRIAETSRALPNH
jgi:GntR family transcriptional regulator